MCGVTFTCAINCRRLIFDFFDVYFDILNPTTFPLTSLFISDKNNHIIDLSHAVDVYHDWIDACETVNATAKAAKSAAQDRDRDDRGSSSRRDRDDRDDGGSSSRRNKPYDRYDDDEDDY